jgi:FAD:protein FMN transferase
MTGGRTRREFLLGGPAAETPDHAARGAAAEPAQPAGQQDRGAEPSLLVHVARRAMACEFEVCLNVGQYPGDAEVAIEALNLVDRLEAQLSVFRADSEVSRLNRTAAAGPVEVEPRLFEVLDLALRLCRETHGAYDITAGPLWEVWGFARRQGAVPSPEQLAEARSRVGGHLVELDSRHRTVRFLQQGVQLNLGSIGKGYALDRCAEQLAAAGICDFLMHGGNSSVLARGTRRTCEEMGTGSERTCLNARETTSSEAPVPISSHPRRSAPWVVGIRDPLHPERRLAEVQLCDQALGTSGAQFQSFRHQGRRYGHILDPRTGWPAEGVHSATVIAPSAALADGLSTAFYVMGPEAALDYCRRHPPLAAVLVSAGSQDGRPAVYTAGLGPEQWRLLP